MLQPAEDALDHDVGQHAQAVLVLGARGDALEDHAPHEALVERPAGVVGEDEAPVAEPVALGALGLAGDGGRDRVQELALLAVEVEVGVDDAVFEEGHAGHAERDLQLAVQELARHVGDGVLRGGALRAHVGEHFAQVRGVAEEEVVHAGGKESVTICRRGDGSSLLLDIGRGKLYHLLLL